MAGFIYKLQNIINTTPNNDNNDVNIARCLLKNMKQIKRKHLCRILLKCVILLPQA